MINLIVDGVKVSTFGLDNFTEAEARNYINYVLENVKIQNTPLAEIEVKLCDDGKVDLGYLFKGEKFERIRRITGKRIAA